METVFDHKKHESEIYNLWEKSEVFVARPDPSKKPFCVIMPPPNANDPLHVGHAMFVSVEDILTRYHRMKGEVALWLPGTDHAGIETQYVFEKKLAKEGKSRFDFERDVLYKMIWDYVAQNSGVAVEQMKRLGASADWTRFKFTLDKDIVNFVLETFGKLYKDGMVYRGERLVNYCTKCGTSYSELEVEYEEKQDKLYFLKYPITGGGYITVATTRPETMLGDTAVAVNPKDKRYKELVGKTVRLPLVERDIPIVEDEMVEMEFGTGAVKITPAHDQADFETGQRHKLEIIPVIDFSGKMNGRAGKFSGMRVAAAREAVLTALTQEGLVEKIEDYKHNVGCCYRCGTVIEPLPLAQFFVKVENLTKSALEALGSKETIILGAGREATLRDWLTHIKDWNISRQIVWGIRIPVWYEVSKNKEMEVTFLDKEKKMIKGRLSELLKTYELPEIETGLQTLRAPVSADYVVAKERPGDGYLQETDTFDTWFSSGQWPVVTLKTNKPGDFEYFYPTSVMDTGYDILTRWVMRMMLFGSYLTGASPFKWVYLHGMVRDEKGRKMSKSIGNVVNPMDLVEKYGADAIRMALVMSTTAGNDSAVGEEKVRGMRNFSNKIWNASRFVALYLEKNITNEEKEGDKEFDKKLLETISEVTDLLEKLKIGQAAEKVHNEFWHWYCDEVIEKAKQEKISSAKLLDGLWTFMKLLHPFMPFVTEAVWQELKELRNGSEDLLIGADWPK